MVGTIGWNRARSWSRAAREAAGTLSGRPDALRLMTEGFLVLLLVAQVVWLVWALALPGSRTLIPTAVPSADLSVLGRFDAFFRTGGRSSLAEVTAPGPSSCACSAFARAVRERARPSSDWPMVARSRLEWARRSNPD
ncbi:hypothetical protein [Brevundimonas sp.]|uniref:hypothetical protein n=1 Tax=Brevundimonas sp. TaxID=1871086 RepID=UPI002ABCBE46|nr:hypothetical protein [Brevundimonas sp.]MDZ4364976.1 hypothetical protein [Brevundimonas sp.]